MTAAGVGLTLTAASTVIFAELHWTPGVLAQAEDRTHRIGQKNSVNVIYCVCKEKDLSIDMSLWSMIGRKVNNIGRIIDGNKNTSLNACDLENETSESQLTSFFAENSPNNDLQIMKNSPAKGSIQSFFIQQKKDTVKSDTEQSNLLEVGKSMTVSSSEKAFHPITKPKTFTLTKIISSNCLPSQWSCHVCTFINHNEPSLSCCEMCGARQKTCKQSTNSVRRSEMQVKDSDPSSTPNVFDLTESDGTSSSNCKFSRSFCSNSSQKIVDLCDSDQEHEDNSIKQKYEEKALVLFDVSLNSGQVALFANHGESLHFNFDMSEVLKEKYLHTQMKRAISYSKEYLTSHEDVLDESGVKQGKLILFLPRLSSEYVF